METVKNAVNDELMQSLDYFGDCGSKGYSRTAMSCIGMGRILWTLDSWQEELDLCWGRRRRSLLPEPMEDQREDEPNLKNLWESEIEPGIQSAMARSFHNLIARIQDQARDHSVFQDGNEAVNMPRSEAMQDAGVVGPPGDYGDYG